MISLQNTFEVSASSGEVSLLFLSSRAWGKFPAAKLVSFFPDDFSYPLCRKSSIVVSRLLVIFVFCVLGLC